MKIDPVIMITRIGMIVLCLVALYMFFLIIFGNSPTAADIGIALTSGLIIYIVQASFHHGKFEGEMKEFKSTAISSFKNIKQDMDIIKQTLQRIEHQRRR